MKKNLLTLTFLFIATSGLFAQGLGFGIKAGVNFANQDISGSGFAIDTKSQVGFHAGVFFNFMFSDKLGLQPEALFSMQGSKFDFSGFDGKQTLNYITIPVLLRYNVAEIFSLHAGPQFGLLMSAEEEFDGGDPEDIKDDFKGTDFGLAFGAEVDLPVKVGFGARYVLGLSDIVEEGGSWDGGEIKNGTFQLYVKYKILGGE